MVNKNYALNILQKIAPFMSVIIVEMDDADTLDWLADISRHECVVPTYKHFYLDSW